MLQEVRDISCAVPNAHDFERTCLRAINDVIGPHSPKMYWLISEVFSGIFKVGIISPPGTGRPALGKPPTRHLEKIRCQTGTSHGLRLVSAQRASLNPRRRSILM